MAFAIAPAAAIGVCISSSLQWYGHLPRCTYCSVEVPPTLSRQIYLDARMVASGKSKTHHAAVGRRRHFGLYVIF